MGRNSIIIIGAGLGGLAAGIYGQINGYQTRIFEMHTQPGGQCTAWKRKGYTFDACIHHLFGCAPESNIYQLWNELGAMPREMVRTNDCTSVLSPDGKLFTDYYDPDKLEAHLNQLSPADSRVVREYINAIKLFMKHDIMSAMVSGSRWDMLKMAPFMLQHSKWMKTTMQQFADKFTDPFLKKAFSLLVYSMPSVVIMLHLVRHAYGISKNIQWPAGGALEFSKSMAKRYQELGGSLHHGSKVVKILVENDRAVGVKLADGSEHRADIVISNADGRRTIYEMLDGKYINDTVRGYCAEPEDESMMAVQVFFGVNRDLSKEPSAMILLLEQPQTIAGHTTEHLETQIYGFDKTMAPPGKSVIKTELTSSYKYWKALAGDRSKYLAEKDRVAKQVLAILEKRYPGLAGQIEATDVSTLITWERFMGGTHGWFNFPVRKMTLTGGSSSKHWENTLPGLANFYFVGVWSSMMGALFMNALSGKKMIQTICRQDGKRFIARA